MHKQVSCGAVVFRKKTTTDALALEVLLVRYGTHHWGFPKGQMEEKETEEETALREIKEETDLWVRLIPGFRLSSSYVGKNKIAKTNVFFVATPLKPSQRPSPQLSELTAAAWFDAQTASQYVTFPGDAEIYLEGRDFAIRHLDKINETLEKRKEKA